MTDFYNVLRSGECGEDSYELADRLQRFVPSFPDQTRVDTNRLLTLFNIRDLDSESRPAALLLITELRMDASAALTQVSAPLAGHR